MAGVKRVKKTVKVKRHVRRQAGRKIVVPEHEAVRFVTINKQERKLFNTASEAGVGKEYGGVIDVDEGGAIERFTTETGGKSDEIALPDYEILWHTHPDRVPNPPSPEDLATLMKNKHQQAEIVFNDGRAMVIVKTPSTKRFAKMSEPGLVKMFEKLFEASMREKDIYKNYAKRLRGVGFIVKSSIRRDAQLKIPVEVVN